MRSVEGDLQPCLIHIDKEGRWFHKGVEMIRREFVQSFYQQMEMDPAGRYIILWGGKRCYVDVEDTAFVVKRVSSPDEQGEKGTGFMVRLSDETEEELMPDTLYLGESNVLYCKVKEGNFPARFNRAAYYQLTAHVEPGEEGYVLPVNGRKFKIGSKDVQSVSNR